MTATPFIPIALVGSMLVGALIATASIVAIEPPHFPIATPYCVSPHATSTNSPSNAVTDLSRGGAVYIGDTAWEIAASITNSPFEWVEHDHILSRGNVFIWLGLEGNDGTYLEVGRTKEEALSGDSDDYWTPTEQERSLIYTAYQGWKSAHGRHPLQAEDIHP